MQRLANKKNEGKEKVIVSLLNKDDLNYFGQLPFDVQYEIITKVISIEIPQFFRDLSRLSPVSKQFLNICKKFVEQHALASQLGDNLMNSRKKIFDTDPAITDSPIFDDLNVIRHKIVETKEKLRQGIARNRFLFGRPDNRSCLGYVTPPLGVLLLPFIIYVLVRNSQCNGEILTTQGWNDQTVNNRTDCLYAPITNFGMHLFDLDFDTTALVMGILFGITASAGSIFAAVGLERLLHLLFDGIQLLILKYQERQELIRLASDRKSNLYDICRECVATIKWQEKIFTHAKNDEAITSLEKIKTTATYKLMKTITTLGNTYRHRARQELFSAPNSTQNRGADEQAKEEHLSMHHGPGGSVSGG